MKILIACLLIAHGLIVAAQAGGSFGGGAYLTNPVWLRWWPTALGQSWLLAGVRAEGGILEAVGGIVWLAAGAALAAAGLGLLGIVVPHEWWRGLAVAGAGASLLMLLVYLHPFFGVGMAASTAVLVVLLWVGWPLVKQWGLQ